MNSSYLTDPVIFIIDTLFSLYILAVMLRFLLQWANADFYNPYSEFIVKITHPPLKFCRRYIPSIGKIDTSCIIFALALQMLADFSILMLTGVAPTLGSLAVLAISQLVAMVINIFIFAIIARAVLSWMSAGTFNAAASILYSLTEPVLSVCRKMVPVISGIDLAPLIALIGLQLAKMFIMPPLEQLMRLIG